MRIVETNINDIPILNINESKLNLAENVIDYIQPIFSKEYKQKIEEVKQLKKSYLDKKEKINQEKIELTNLLSTFSKKNKEKELLGKMGKLIHTGLIQESMKNEMSILLKTFEKISEEKIISYLNETIKILGQRFAKS